MCAPVIAGPVGRLDPEHGFVSLGYELFRRSLARPGDYTAGRAKLNRLPSWADATDTQPANPFSQVTGLSARIVQVGMYKKYGEFIPAEPADNICLAHMREDHVANPLERRIASSMSKPVIHGLEPVKIQIDQAQGYAMTGCAGHFPVQLALERPAIEDRAQRIPVGHLL